MSARERLTAAPAPHVHAGADVACTMRRVQLALLPATLFGLWSFGWPAVHLFLITVGAALLTEAVCQHLRGCESRPWDGSALLTGWLLALSLPPWAPGWLGALGGVIAIALGKQVYGGLGQNLFNPAMVARVALLVSFPVAMTHWVAPLPLGSEGAPGFIDGLRITLGAIPVPDAVTSASLLGHAKTELSRGVELAQALDAAGGTLRAWHEARPGSLGETGALLLLAGGLYLLARGVIRWHIPAGVLAGLALPAALAHAVDPGHYLSAWAHLGSGAVVLGAFFITTDYVTSPSTASGQLLYGLGIGLLTWIIRSWGGYPEGIAFAVLLFNALTPVIDRYCRPRIMGRTRRGAPIRVTQGSAE